MLNIYFELIAIFLVAKCHIFIIFLSNSLERMLCDQSNGIFSLLSSWTRCSLSRNRILVPSHNLKTSWNKSSSHIVHLPPFFMFLPSFLSASFPRVCFWIICDTAVGIFHLLISRKATHSERLPPVSYGGKRVVTKFLV